MATLGPDAAQRYLIVIGAPRSGTTWAGKLFDSHPDVIYRHEPDTLERNDTIPVDVPPADVEQWRGAARAYLLRLFGKRTLKTVGQLPLFAKHYRTPAGQDIHETVVYGLRGLALTTGCRRGFETVRVPDLMASCPELAVMKSVSACGRAGLFAAALPEARMLFMIRSPFAQVGSMLRGVRMGLMDPARATRHLAARRGAALYGLTEAFVERFSLCEKLAWHWALTNEAALADLAGRPGVRIILYHDLRAAPIAKARELMAFAGLGWTGQSEDFVRRSTSYGGRERFYQIWRDTSKPDDKWRAILSADERRQVGRIIGQTSLASWIAPDGRGPADGVAPHRADTGRARMRDGADCGGYVAA